MYYIYIQIFKLILLIISMIFFFMGYIKEEVLLAQIGLAIAFAFLFLSVMSPHQHCNQQNISYNETGKICSEISERTSLYIMRKLLSHTRSTLQILKSLTCK